MSDQQKTTEQATSRPIPRGITPAPSDAISTMHRVTRPLHTQIQEAEKRIFDKWYATATTGAKLRYWQQRIQQLKARQPDSPAAG